MSVEEEFVERTKRVTGYLRSLRELENAHHTPGRGFYRATAAITASRASSFITMYNCIEFGVRSSTASLRREIVIKSPAISDLKRYWKEDITRARFHRRLSQGTNYVQLIQDFADFLPGSVEWGAEIERIPFLGNVDNLELIQFMRRIEHRWTPPPTSLGGNDLNLIRRMRNELAHGHETFEAVGSLFQTDELVEKFRRARRFMVSLIKSLERYKANQKFLR
ncbi:MAG: hypothetical protein ACXW27_12445 [Allosphingosinicella sp.]